MDVLLSIGDFSRMTHLSIKALRRYHDRGLLVPADVDPLTGYRSYGLEQVAVGQAIRRFRDLGMPLDRVDAVIHAPDLETRNREITAHLREMEDQLEETRKTVGGLRALLEGPPARTTVELRHLATAPALGIREVVDTDELAGWWVEAMAEIGATLAAAGAAPAGPHGGLFPGELFELDRAEVTAFVPLEAGAGVGGSAVSASGGRGGRVERLEIPAVDVAVAVHAGSIADLDRTYAALGAVVAERAIGLDGPMREYYLVSPLDTDDESRHRTEVCWPVFPAGGQVEVGSASP